MAEGRVCAIFGIPVRGCPAVMVKITDAGVVGREPVVRGKSGREYAVNVAVDGNIGI